MTTPQAYSRFQEINGDIYWAKCTVISFDKKTGLFLIEWDGSGRRKNVARFNLRFAREIMKSLRKELRQQEMHV